VARAESKPELYVVEGISVVEVDHGRASGHWLEQAEAEMTAEAGCNRSRNRVGESHSPETAVTVRLVQASLVAETVKANGIARLVTDLDGG
jgi:hypothetical protein